MKQEDKNPNESQPVYPSIRFHHSHNFWHRIEGRKNGIHIKTGDIQSDNYSDFFVNNISSIGKIKTNINTELHGKNELNLIRFGKDGDYQILHKTNGAFQRNTLAMHVHHDDAFGVYSSGWNPLMEVKGGSGDMYVKGNMGIGTNNPETKLDVKGTIAASAPIKDNHVVTKSYLNKWGNKEVRRSYGRGRHKHTRKSTACPNGYYVVGINVDYGGTCHFKCDGDGGIIQNIELVCRPIIDKK